MRLKVAQIKEVPHQVETLQMNLRSSKANESLQAKIAAQQANNVLKTFKQLKWKFNCCRSSSCWNGSITATC